MRRYNSPLNTPIFLLYHTLAKKAIVLSGFPYYDMTSWVTLGCLSKPYFLEKALRLNYVYYSFNVYFS